MGERCKLPPSGSGAEPQQLCNFYNVEVTKHRIIAYVETCQKQIVNMTRITFLLPESSSQVRDYRSLEASVSGLRVNET